MFGKKEKTLNSKTPQWFREWHANYFKPVDSRSLRNEKMIYLILAAVLAMNTIGNHYHTEIVGFIMRPFGG